MTYMVLDLETQTHEYKKRKGSRWHPDNYIVAAGWKVGGDASCSWWYNRERNTDPVTIPDNVKVLVGFNLKYDLLWLWDRPELRSFFKRGGWVWDCQYVEYLLHGQDPRYQYCSLTETAPRYGGTAKIDEVAVLWDAGVQTSDIEEELLVDYLVGPADEGRNGGDIGNTEKIFLGQVKAAREAGMLTAIRSRMDGLCATTEMEFNGLKIDLDEARAQFKALRAERASLKDKLQQYVPELPDGLEFKWGSGVHKSSLIFGGTVKYKKQSTYTDPKTGELARFKATEVHWLLEDGTTTPKLGGTPPDGCVRFKSGKKQGQGKTKQVSVPGELKQKYCDFFFEFPGYTEAIPDWLTKNTDGVGGPVFSTSGDVISALAGRGVAFCDDLARYEQVQKELTTYFISDPDSNGDVGGMLTCVREGIINHKLNHVSTVTGRLSSSDPNLQNIPRKDKSQIKKLFVSRYDDGVMIEADYSQLEVVVQGLLSGDKQLCQDLRDRIDFHCKRVAAQSKYSISYTDLKDIVNNEAHPDHSKWKGIRTKAKEFSFQRAYGAGKWAIAASTGMKVEDVEDLIDVEERTYPGITAFNNSVAQTVEKCATKFRDPEHPHIGFRRGYWKAPTGCVYTFRSYVAPDYLRDRGIEESFSPTEMKNYPIQGTGGEFVQGKCGELWRRFVETDNYNGNAVLCNTVHDCVWVDSSVGVLDEVAQDVQRIMEGATEWFAQFGMTIDVPFPVEVEYGPNMLELKHYKKEVQ